EVGPGPLALFAAQHVQVLQAQRPWPLDPGRAGAGQTDRFAVAVRQPCGLVGPLPQRLLPFGQPLAFGLLEGLFWGGAPERLPASAAQEFVECVGVTVVRRANSC